MANRLPNVKIAFANGALGIASPMDDGCAGLVCSAAAVSTTFVLHTPYRITSLAGLEALGVTEENNEELHRTVKDFYKEAPAGSVLWVMGVDGTTMASFSPKFHAEDNSSLPVRNMLIAAGGEIRLLMAKIKYDSAPTLGSHTNLDEDIADLCSNLNGLCHWAAETLYAPCIGIMEALGFDGTNSSSVNDTSSMHEGEYDRVAVVIGDTSRGGTASHPETTNYSAIGLVAGRLAAIPVQRSLARVRDGKINASALYMGGADVNNSDAETLLSKGFVVPRTYVGKTGCYWADDPLCCDPESDYSSIARRRVADKAYRIAYRQCVELIGEEIAVTAEGKIPAPVCKGIEAGILSAIVKNMTAEGNLATDPADPNDLGVTVFVDPESNIVSNSRLDVAIRVRPFGYAKYIEVNLGFQTVSE